MSNYMKSLINKKIFYSAIGLGLLFFNISKTRIEELTLKTNGRFIKLEYTGYVDKPYYTIVFASNIDSIEKPDNYFVKNVEVSESEFLNISSYLQNCDLESGKQTLADAYRFTISDNDKTKILVTRLKDPLQLVFAKILKILNGNENRNMIESCFIKTLRRFGISDTFN